MSTNIIDRVMFEFNFKEVFFHVPYCEDIKEFRQQARELLEKVVNPDTQRGSTQIAEANGFRATATWKNITIKPSSLRLEYILCSAEVEEV